MPPNPAKIRKAFKLCLSFLPMCLDLRYINKKRSPASHFSGSRKVTRWIFVASAKPEGFKALQGAAKANAFSIP